MAKGFRPQRSRSPGIPLRSRRRHHAVGPLSGKGSRGIAAASPSARSGASNTLGQFKRDPATVIAPRALAYCDARPREPARRRAGRGPGDRRDRERRRRKRSGRTRSRRGAARTELIERVLRTGPPPDLKPVAGRPCFLPAGVMLERISPGCNARGMVVRKGSVRDGMAGGSPRAGLLGTHKTPRKSTRPCCS